MKWTNDISVGSLAVDNQHKKLFDTIDKLMEACNQRKGKDEIEPTLIFLYKYTQIHFKDEEKLLLDNHYPKYEEQKRSHDKFTEEIRQAIQQYNEEGANLTVLLNVLNKCNEWLLVHIMKMDKEYATFFKEKNLKME
ncbi:bacteriohemerythrin [Clostridium grantii]|uniref:Hemerythrin n=1 Tax=Clostridium grantii DSM 8605 TaxID=1121316 RepID=A0A1M5X776_9CLOT|nr:hemerythrin family protein [Clostridium grantii]SHH95616.1 hemerythrin [Clostridium grantii DSM 8605]